MTTSIPEAKQAQIAKALGVDSLAVPEAELAKWTALATDLADASKTAATLAKLNEAIQPVTFLHGNHATLADLAVLGAAHDVLARLPEADRLKCLSVCRWYDHVQFLPGVAQLGLSTITFDRNVPLQVAAPGADDAKRAAQKAKKDELKKKKDAEKAARAAQCGSGGGAKGGAKGGELPDQPPASMLDMRVGHIIKAWKHPDADALYVEEIDVGEDAPRTVVSGLVRHIPEAEMQDRMVVVLCNLKPSAMRGIKSFAMVLCATNADGEKTEFVIPPAGSKPGDRVFLPGMEAHSPLEMMPPKKKIFEAVQPEFNTSDDKVARWKDLPFTVKDHGVCTTANVAGGSIK